MDLKGVRAFCGVADGGGFSRVAKPGLEQMTWLAVGTQRPATLAARTVARLVRQILTGR